MHIPCRLSTGYRTSARLSTALDVETAVIFVHGFNGHPETTWLDLQTLVDRDDSSRAVWANADLFFWGYASVSKPVRYNTHLLRKFIADVYPKPSMEIFRVQLQGQSFVPEVVLRSDFIRYKNLILVGHSEGSVLIRTLVRDDAIDYTSALRRSEESNVEGENEDQPLDSRGLAAEPQRFRKAAESLLSEPKYASLRAHLRLFAPAHGGHSVSGFLGAFLGTPGISSLCKPALAWSTAYSDLARDSPLITGLRSDTNELAANMPWITALRAKLLWGANEMIVHVDKYREDTEEYVPDKDHASVCKPTLSYSLPLRFVLQGVENAKRAGV